MSGDKRTGMFPLIFSIKLTHMVCLVVKKTHRRDGSILTGDSALLYITPQIYILFR